MAILQVGKDGKAPAGAKVGDTIKTAGGEYKITGGSAGSWTSEKVSSGGANSSNSKNSGSSGGSSSSSNIPYNIGSAKGQQIADNLSAGQSYQASDGSTWVKNRDGSVSVTTKNGTYTPNAYQSQVPVMQQVPTPQAAYTDPTLIGKSIGDLYGLTYDYGTILKLLNDATKSSYASQQQEFGATENQFYRNMIGSQEDTLNILRENQAKAVATGASKGIAAANELSAILNLQDVAGQGASDLASQRNLLMDKERAAYEKNASDALNTSNSLKTAIAGLDLSKYGYDVQEVIGKLDYLANVQNADKTLEGVKYNADQNLAGTIAANKFTGNYGSGGYYGGGGGVPTGGTPAGTPATTPTQGGTTQLAALKPIEDFMSSKETSFSPTGSNVIYTRQDNGKYTLQVPGQTPINDLTQDDLRKVFINGNNPEALKAGYGTTTTTQSGTPKSKLEAETGTTRGGGSATTGLTTGTVLSHTTRSGDNISYVYDSAKGGWYQRLPNGTKSGAFLSTSEMNKRIATGEITGVKITKP